jgi:rhomboid protease GluP
MCPQCRAFISSDDKVCPYCNETVGARAAAPLGPSQALESLVPDHSTVTLLFLLINVAFWIATVMISANEGNGGAIVNLDNRTLILLGAKWRPEIVYSGQWWRLILAGFLHGGFTHIFMNGLWLYYAGRQVEDFFGPVRFFIIYTLSTIAGFWMSMWVSPQSVSVGASAAILGLIGALLASSSFPGSPTEVARKTYGYWTLGLLLLGFIGNWTGQSRTDNAAHIGGFLAGYALALIMRFPNRQQPAAEAFWRVVAALCVGATLFSFWKMYLSFSLLSQSPAYRAF